MAKCRMIIKWVEKDLPRHVSFWLIVWVLCRMNCCTCHVGFKNAMITNAIVSERTSHFGNRQSSCIDGSFCLDESARTSWCFLLDFTVKIQSICIFESCISWVCFTSIFEGGPRLARLSGFQWTHTGQVQHWFRRTHITLCLQYSILFSTGPSLYICHSHTSFCLAIFEESMSLRHAIFFSPALLFIFARSVS